MDLIALTIMSRAEPPTRTKCSELQPIPFNSRAITTNVAKDITDSFDLFHSCDLHRNARIFILQPLPNSLWFLLVGTVNWPLRGIPPALDVLTHGSNRQLKTEALPNQLLHCFSRPERKI